MNTQIKKTAFIADTDSQLFFKEQQRYIDEFQVEGLIPELHYQMAIENNGEALHSVMIFGREKWVI